MGSEESDIESYPQEFVEGLGKYIEDEVDSIDVLNWEIDSGFPKIEYRTYGEEHPEIVHEMGEIIACILEYGIGAGVPADRVKMITHPNPIGRGPSTRWHVKKQWIHEYSRSEQSEEDIGEQVLQTLENFEVVDAG